MIETMYRTKLIGIKGDIFELIDVLRNLKVFHVIESSRTGKDEDEDLNFHNSKLRLESLETRMSAILSHVTDESFPRQIETKMIRSNEEIINETDNILTTIEPIVKEIETEKEELNSKIEHLNKYEPVLRHCKPLIHEMTKKPNLESNIIIFNRRSDLGIVDFEKDLDTKTNGLYELIPRRVDENYLAILLLYDKEYSKEIQTYLASEKISSLTLSPELGNVKLQEMNSKITELISNYNSRLKALEKETNKIIETPEFTNLLRLNQEAIYRLSAFQLAEKMGGTENTFEIEGFIPKSQFKNFESKLKDSFGNRILIEKEKAKSEAPVLRKNPRLIKPFEIITNLIQLPEYGSIDPTPLVFLFFTFFWGFMVGDVGYALIIFVIAAILRRRFKKNQQQALQNITEIFMISCVVAMFFGLLYFEIFGNLAEEFAHKVLGWHFIEETGQVEIHLNEHTTILYPIINRYKMVQPLLILSIILGYLIIMGGMLLGIYNNYKLNHISHVYGNLLLILIWGSIPLLLFIAIISPDLFGMALIFDILIIIIAIAILIRLEGIAGLIHVIEKFSNILSFARLMAIGLVGAWMGKIANDLATQSNIFPLGIIMGLGLHLINIVILILSPSIHSMRLNVFEFFTQFVLEGGNVYKPYGTN